MAALLQRACDGAYRAASLAGRPRVLFALALLIVVAAVLGSTGTAQAVWDETTPTASYLTSAWNFWVNFLPNLWRSFVEFGKQMVGYAGGAVNTVIVWATQGVQLLWSAICCIPVTIGYKVISCVCYLTARLVDILSQNVLPTWKLDASKGFQLPEFPPIVKGMALVLPVGHFLAVFAATTLFILPFMVVGAVGRWLKVLK